MVYVYVYVCVSECECVRVCVCVCVCARVCACMNFMQVLEILSRPYGVATISRLLKIIGLFCKRAL